MSMPVSQQPPAVTITQASFNSHTTHGSIGPVIGVLVVIMILGIVAVMIGRLCSGKRILGYGQYDIENWAEAKCSSCIDGRISPPPHLPSSRSNVPSMPPQTHQEIKQEELPPPHPPQNI